MQNQERENQMAHSRSIKFRAWDKISKQMFNIYSIVYKEDGIHVLLDWKSKVTGFRENWLTPNRLVLMQYTGLKDKNGKEIYEGDIVYLGGYGNYEVEFPFIELYEAETEKDIGEIIGNVYQQPELL